MNKVLKRGRWYVCRQPCGGGYVVGWSSADDPHEYPMIALGVMTYPNPEDVERRIAEILSDSKATARRKGEAVKRKPLAKARKSDNANKST